MQELLADEIALFARELDELDDLLGHALLLLERKRYGCDNVLEVGLRALDCRHDHLLVRVEEVLDDDHRVVPLLDGLAVEVGREPGERLSVVVDGERDVLL